MKGIIFRGLEELVVSNYGMQTWNHLLSQHAPDNRVYISAQSYPDAELLHLAEQISVELDIPMNELLKGFGKFLFGYLGQFHGDLVSQFADFKALILAIDSVIHVEVAKLYHEPHLPVIDCQQISDKQILMTYNSKRQLCIFAEGLAYGAAAHYQVDLTVTHQHCVHTGDAECKLLLEWS
jgi:hypothetical protein